MCSEISQINRNKHAQYFFILPASGNSFIFGSHLFHLYQNIFCALLVENAFGGLISIPENVDA